MHTSNIHVADINSNIVEPANHEFGDTMKRLAAIFLAAAIVTPLAYVALATAAGMVS